MTVKNMRRKKWTTPQLVVLVKGKLEEGSLLINCKYTRTAGDPTTNNVSCLGNTINCLKCSDEVRS
jgi:hypothetical protein